MPGDSWKLAPGLHNVGSYQVSGIPFVSGGIDARTALKIQFPSVTKWVWVQNRDDSNDLKVGVSEAGVRADAAWTGAGYAAGTYFFTVEDTSTAPDRASHLPTLPVKISELWLSGSTAVDVMAGLTYVPKQRTDTTQGTSWSGSNGVGQ